MQAINSVRRAPAVLRTAAPLSTWSAVPAGPPDPILGQYDPPSLSAHSFFARYLRGFQSGQRPTQDQPGCRCLQGRKRQILCPERRQEGIFSPFAVRCAH